jgi:6-pyruvoyltetrahydropterin/6-carboxytetrahydropterin synthase
MTKIRVTKIFTFEMAHALWNYDGLCQNIHGHSYKLFLTLIGTPVNDAGNPKNGMVVDFGDIKTLVKEEIIKDFDHALVISQEASIKSLGINNQMFSKLKIVDYQPTVENLLDYFARLIKEKLPPDILLHSLKLQETETAYAEWFAEDNP